MLAGFCRQPASAAQEMPLNTPVDPGLLALCDGVFSLPMTGGKSSLNVAVAFGIAVYHLRFGLRDVIT